MAVAAPADPVRAEGQQRGHSRLYSAADQVGAYHHGAPGPAIAKHAADQQQRYDRYHPGGQNCAERSGRTGTCQHSEGDRRCGRAIAQQ